MTREHIKVLDIPSAWGKEKKEENKLPRLEHIEMGGSAVLPQARNEK